MAAYGRHSQRPGVLLQGISTCCRRASSCTVAPRVCSRCFLIGVRKLPSMLQPATSTWKSQISIQGRRTRTDLREGGIANDDRLF
jgi:hypothetical protein